MAESRERWACGLRLRIDRELCVGFGDCVEAAPGAFVLDGEGLAVFAAPENATREALIAACDACPVDALTAWDDEGRQLAPERKPRP